ncbi:MAG: DoxX family protein [Saprospiraceae bacterium]|nr:DoxX family protein [Saprospiraceae bacterium]
MKKDKIIYWTATILIFLFEGVMPALTSHTEMAKEGIRHLGYPEYFGMMLMLFKVAGALVLILPQIPSRLKEWAYAGFTFDFLAATYSHLAVDGLQLMSFFPLLVLGVLMVSYYYYFYKLNPRKKLF